jgi:hypothetical protein
MSTGPKRHHQVPRFYLQRFAADGRVLVRRRDGKVFEAAPENVAVEAGFYDVPDGEGGKSKDVERMLAGIEGSAKTVMDSIDRAGAPPSDRSAERNMLSLFLALQMTRTTEHRERVLFPGRVIDWAGDREITQGLVAEYLEQEHLGFAPMEREAEGAFLYVSEAMKDPIVFTSEFAINTMLRSVQDLVPRLLEMNWTLEIDGTAQLTTSDMPVVTWRKPTPRDEYEGLGIEKADELRFPLDPGKQLVLSRRNRPDVLRVAVHRVRRCNVDLAGACHRFIVGRPDQRSRIEAVRLDEWRPVIRFNVGPLLEEGPDGQLRERGEVLHMWVPRRSGVGRPSSER